MPPGKRLRKQMALIEFKSCKEEVDALLALDFNPKLIHERLTEQGRMTMAYTSFTQILRNSQRKNAAAPVSTAAVEKRPPAASPVRPQSRPGIIKTGPEPFPDPKNIDPKTLI
jgi:TATA-binding protein-associated factor Taf7